MGTSRTDFKDTRFYPVIFMILITVVFIGVLATFYYATEEKVRGYQEENLKQMILKLFDFPSDNIREDYQKYIIEITLDEYDYSFYRAVQDSVNLGICFPISGSGLWGTITALLAVTPDMNEIIALEIVSQNETPGLGGRITENWFKEQFRNKQIIIGKNIIKFELIPEEEKQKDNEVKQITGASQSSKAVVSILYNEMRKIASLIGFDYE